MLHVAAAAIVNARGEVLIARRPDHVHQGGRWEFPGGKIEPGETVEQALARELHEELGIELRAARPLIRVPHAYPEHDVLLDVWRVEAFDGEPHGREGQPIAWCAIGELRAQDFPAANRPIITALRLPDRYLITPEPGADREVFLQQLRATLLGGIRLVQLRVKTLDEVAYRALAEETLTICHAAGAQLLLNAAPGQAVELGADGVHLTAARLRALDKRPLPPHLWVAASVHDREELAHAAAIGADFAVLGPVQTTATHPQTIPLGWPGFAALAADATLPVYAVGGLAVNDLDTAFHHGAQGVAAIRGLWTF